MTVLCVAQDGHFVVIEVNFVDKHIHQSLPVFGVIDVSLAELVEEKANFLHAGGRVLGVFQKKLKGEFVMFFLLLRNSVGDNVNGLSALQGLQQVFCGLLIFCKQFFKPPCVAIVTLPLAEVNDFSGNHADIVRGQEIPQSVDYQILYVFFSNCLFVTGFIPAVGHALIIVILPLCLTRSTDTSHGGLAVSAEQFRCQQVVHFRLRSCGGFFVLLHNALCLPKQIFINDAGEPIRNFLIPVCIYPYVPLIPQNAVDAVLVELIPIGRFDLVGVEIPNNICHCGASHIHFKNFHNDWGGQRIDYNSFPLRFEPQRKVAASRKTLLGVNVHPPLDFLCQFHTVIFSHPLQNGFHQHTACIVRNIFTGRQHTDPVLFQF